jgi:type IV pilus assembly protein PilY1
MTLFGCLFDRSFIKRQFLSILRPIEIAFIFTAFFFCPVPSSWGASVVFNTEGSTLWTVPAGATSITVKAWGGGGGGGGAGEQMSGAAGGGAGFAQATLNVTPGESLSIYVGGAGDRGRNSNNRTGGGGQGGGYSGVKRGGTDLVIAAGGGGGGGGDNASGTPPGAGGAGGGTPGGAGGPSDTAAGGGGGTSSAGGAAGGGSATAGSSLTGGKGGSDGTGGGAGGSGGTNAGGNGGSGTAGRPGGGGGGAGKYGGGGGEQADSGATSGAGGGGGSSYTTGTATSTSAGSGRNAGNNGDPDYADDAGKGGNATGAVSARVGVKGRVVITYATATSYTITASSGANGSISPSGPVSVPAGDSLSFTISPNPGCMILQVLVDGVAVGAVSSYTFTNVNANHTIQASFAGQYTINTIAGSHGSISPPGPVSIASGGTQSFSILPDSGYTVDRVLVDGVSVGAVSSYLFTNVNADHTIEAQFVSGTAPPDLSTCLNISDIPLEVRRLSAPPNIMVLFDDSGSMDWEILMPGSDDGVYYDGSKNNYYVFDNPCGSTVGSKGCHDDTWRILARGSSRLVWRTQWFGQNKTYYNPAITYEPWQTMTSQYDNSDPDTPRSHPLLAAPTFNLSNSYDTVGSLEVIADNENPAVFTKTGSWTAASDVQAYNDTYYITAQDDSDVTATWSPYLLAGQYQVFTRYRAADNRENQVPYKITHAGGTSTVLVDQREHGGEWVSLGSYNFATGTANVTIAFHVDENDEDRVCADAVKFVPQGSIPVDIKNAHYYVWSGLTSTPYLVIIDGGVIKYYQVNDYNADGKVDPGELVETISPPADVVTGRTYVQERQNFANWFTFFRRRIFAAQYAVGKIIKSMQGVRVGIYSINKKIIQPVLPVKVEGQDEGATLLSLLYNVQARGYTPLQTGLEAVGRYYDKGDDKKLDGTAGDDSPWYSDANGGSCQQAFTIMITDGYYNGDPPYNTSIQNVDGDNGSPYADSYSRTLADIAMYYYERDLNTTLNDSLPVNPYDDATHQHMVTYSIGFGVFGSLNQNDYDAALKHKVSGASIVWPDPQNSDATKIDDLWHAAVNGRGSYLTATNPEELTESLLEVMQNMELRVQSSAQVAVTGDKLYQKLTPNLLMFQNIYSSDGWTGDIKAYSVDPVTGAVDTNHPEWSAAEKLLGKTSDSRIIATYTGSAGTPFRYGSLTASQKSQLDANYLVDSTRAQNLVNFLRGDASNEVLYGGTFRNRFARLGDIVHSAPVFSHGILYAGSNDGLLHAFNANSGVELFAYAPNLVFDHLKELAGTSYAHRYFVDLTPSVSDLKFGATTKTYLVGGLGKGGRGYFALDVTGLTQTNVPSSENSLAQKVMWEYPRAGTSSSEIADLGYSFSRANIVRSNAAAAAAAAGIVIFGNGYDSSNGHAVLYILRADTGELLKRIDTGVGSCNGLSSAITVDVNYDNKVDYVYAGDLKGNLWKFDLTSTDYNQWGVAYSSAGTPKPLFKTPGQPITTKPNVMYHCTKDGYMVLFGTGRYLNEDDLSDSSPQAVYGIWDYGDDADDSEYVGTLAAGALTDTNLPGTVSLLQQVVVDERTVNGMKLRTLAAQAADWKATSTSGGPCGDNSGTQGCDPNPPGNHPDPLRHAGWYLNLPGARERVVSDVIVRSGVLTVVSHAPSNSLCGGSGESWLMTMDACSGARLSKAFFDINNDGKIDSADLVNIGTPENPIMVVPSGIRYDGKVQPPAYLIMPNGTENLYMSSTKAKIETQRERAAKLGMTYWRVMH